MNRLLLFGFIGLTGLAGCNSLANQAAEIIGHPANPNSKQGKTLAVTKALDEKEDLSDPFQTQSRSNPAHRNPVPTKTDDGHSAHKMHKH